MNSVSSRNSRGNREILSPYILREKRPLDVVSFMPMTECYVDICK